DAADAGVVADAPLVLALPEWPLRGGDQGERRSACGRGTLRPRGLPFRERPWRDLFAHHQGRLRGREDASRRDGAAPGSEPADGLGVFPSSALDVRTEGRTLWRRRPRRRPRADLGEGNGPAAPANAALPRAARARS